MNFENDRDDLNEYWRDALDSDHGRNTPDVEHGGPVERQEGNRRRLKDSFTMGEALEIGYVFSRAFTRNWEEGNPEPHLDPQEIECLLEIMTCPEDECSPG